MRQTGELLKIGFQATRQVLPSGLLMVALFGAALVAGCQKNDFDPKEYGKVVPTLPKVKGAEKEYEFPQLKVEPQGENEPDK